MTERVLLVAPSWVGDAILSEPLVALLRERCSDALIDALSPPWCGPVYARMRGIRRVIANPIGHGSFDLAGRRRLAAGLRDSMDGGYTQAIVLPNSWKSALVPWLARIPVRTGFRGEMRFGLLNDLRHLGRRPPARLVDRFALLASRRNAPPQHPEPPVLVPDPVNRAAAATRLDPDLGDARLAVLCPGAEYGPAKRWPVEHCTDLARRFVADGYRVWLIGSPKDRADAAAIVATAGADAGIVNLAGRTDLGTAIDLLSLATVVVSNDSGLMHAAAAVGVPLVALFGSSSPAYTPPLSPRARIARIDIACSPCFKRSCPLGHLRCLRDLTPDTVYDLARHVVDSPVSGG